MKLHPRLHVRAATAKFSNRSASLGRIVLSRVITQALRQELSGMTDLEDGGLLVSFEANGLVEMAWHLAKWATAIEVIEPAALRELVVVHQRETSGLLP
jgi:predicted DNA-binding transcriptional regulator YafY